MAGRMAKFVGDDDSIPVIDTVKVSKTKTSELETIDPFSKRIEDSAELAGASKGFKRKTTTKIIKFRRGQDGAESAQVHEKDDITTGYNIFDVVEPLYNQDYLAKLYELSAPHYASVNAKVANIVGLGYRLVENNKTKRNFERMADDEEKTKKTRRRLNAHRDEVLEILEELNEEDTFTETMMKVWRDYEVTGNGYLEIGRKKDGTIGYLGHIPAQTIRIRKPRDGFVQMSGFKVQFFAHFGAGIDEDGNPQPINNPLNNGAKTNEVIHLKKYSPTSGYYGVPDVVAATHAITGNEFAARFNLDYFENKAVPRYAIILKGAELGQQAEERLMGFFETVKGENHRSVYIPLPSDTPDNKVELELKAIEAGIQDSSFDNYKKSNDDEIYTVHRVPKSKVSVNVSGSLAQAKDADKTFKEQVCAPEQKIWEKKVNKVIKELTDAFELKFNEMSLTDENTQSQIDERRRKTGEVTANENRIRRGEVPIEGGDELFDMNAQLKLGQEANKLTQQQLKNQKEQADKAHELAKNPPKPPTPTATSPVANRERDSQRSANRTDSAGAARNPKGEGRTTP